MNTDIKDILFIDIETIRTTRSYDELGERFKAQWARKASFLRRDQDITDAELFHDRGGIYAEFGKIIVIAAGKYTEANNGLTGFKTRYFAGTNEQEILTNFKAMLEKMDPQTTRLCAHNGREFDFPYLCRRMLVNGIIPPSLLNQTNRKPWDVTLLDTMDMWKFGDFKHYTSLDLLSALFGIATSKDTMDGSMVNDVYYVENDLNKIVTYCVNDVVAIGQVYLRLKGMDLIKEEHIVHT